MKRTTTVMMILGVLFSSIASAQVPVLWNKLGSFSEVSNSVIGAPGTKFGTVGYRTGKFNFGSHSDAYQSCVWFQNQDFTGLEEKGSMEFWLSSDTLSQQEGAVVIQLEGEPRSWNGSGAIMYIGVGGGKDFSLACNLSGANINLPISSSLSTNVLHHIAISWDKNSITPSGDTFRVYLDNVKVKSTNITFNYLSWDGARPTLTAGNGSISLFMGGYEANWKGTYSTSRIFRGVIDNLKVWNFAKTNFSDRLIESGNSSPFVFVNEPNGVSDSADTSFTVKYIAADADDAITASLFYDNNNSGFDGTPITSGLAETTNGSYTWNTSALPNGTYYVYAIANDGFNPAVKVYSAGAVTVNHPSAGLLLWNKLGSVGEIQNSMIGPNGTVAGAVNYGPTKYSNGLNCDTMGEYALFDNSVVNLDRGCIEFWVKANHNGPATIHKFWFDSRNETPNSTGGMIDSSLGLTAYEANGMIYFTYNVITTTYSVSYTTGTLMHFAFVWDKSAGIAGSKTLAIYKDGVLVSSTASALPSFASSGAFMVGARNCGLDYNADDYIDNIKTWNFAKTDFSDRTNENGSGSTNVSTALAAPTALQAEGKKSEITLSWNPVGTAVAYRIYRSTRNGVTASTANYLAESASPSYSDMNVASETRYYYVVTAVNSVGTESAVSGETWAVTGEKETKIIVTGNKFDPENGEAVTVKFKTEKTVSVRFRIFAIDGTLVYETENMTAEPGEHQRKWAGVSNNLTAVSPGVYILQIVIDDVPGEYEKVIVYRKNK